MFKYMNKRRPLKARKVDPLIARKVDPPQAQMKILISQILVGFDYYRTPQHPHNIIRSNHSAVFSPSINLLLDTKVLYSCKGFLFGSFFLLLH